jgi:hypothetical protein
MGEPTLARWRLRPRWKGHTGTWLVKYFPYIQCDYCVWRSHASRGAPDTAAEAAFRRHIDKHVRNDLIYRARHRAPEPDL